MAPWLVCGQGSVLVLGSESGVLLAERREGGFCVGVGGGGESMVWIGTACAGISW